MGPWMEKKTRKKKKEAVIDSGPIIHLAEIGRLGFLEIYDNLIVPKLVEEEVGHILNLKNITVSNLNKEESKKAEQISKAYLIEEADAQCLLLASKLKIDLLTDDLKVKRIAKLMGLGAHGTIGTAFANYSARKITIGELENIANDLYYKSTLYLTWDLYQHVLKEVEARRKRW